MTTYKKKTWILVFLLFSLITSCSKKAINHTTQVLVLTNTSSLDLKEKAIEIKRKELTTESSKYFPVLSDEQGNTIPSQLDDLNGDGEWDALFLLINISKKTSKKLVLNWVNKPLKFQKKTSVRFGKRSSASSPVIPANQEILIANQLPKNLGYQQYQTDGPSWENDKVGFRHYLDGRNAKDVFGKKIPEISPETVGINKDGAVEDNYHVMEDWGRDILSVGNSLGLGGYAISTENNLIRLGVTSKDTINNIETTTFKIITEGPLRSTLNFTYKNWKLKGRSYNVDEHTSIWPGMYAYKNSVKLSGLKGDEDLVIGLVNRDTKNNISELIICDDYVILYTHDKQTYNNEWWLGMALILPKEKYKGFLEAPEYGKLSQTFLAKMNVKNLETINYYAVACWELSDPNFKDEAYFKKYLINLTNQLSAKVLVSIK